MASKSRFLTATITTTLVVLSVALITGAAPSDKDKEECAESLAGLATCLPYVGGTAKAPTPDCCGGLKQVLQNNKKCLCVVIKDRNDPDLALNINATLALGLPHVCHAPANVSQCPALLGLSPNSPEAQIFYQLGKNSSSSSISPGAGGPTASSSTAAGNPTNAPTEVSRHKTGGGGSGRVGTSFHIVPFLCAVLCSWCMSL